MRDKPVLMNVWIVAAIAFSVWPLWTGCVQRAPPVQQRFDFRDSQFDGLQLGVTDPAMARRMRPEDDGLLMELPGGEGVGEVAFSPRMSLEGDFEIAVAYEIIDIASPDRGYGVGPRIYVATASNDEDAATISRCKSRDGADVYSAHRAQSLPTDSGERQRKHSVQTAPTTATAGQLCLRRIGKELAYLVSDEEKRMLTEIRKLPFTDADVTSIRIGLDRGGATSAAAVRWKDLAIRADAFATGQNQISWEALLGVATLAALLLASTAWYWPKSGTAAAMTESARRAPADDDVSVDAAPRNIVSLASALSRDNTRPAFPHEPNTKTQKLRSKI